MQTARQLLLVALMVLIAISGSLDTMTSAASAHKKPPFNGSIFGKRSMGASPPLARSMRASGASSSVADATATSANDNTIDGKSQRETFADIIASTVDDYLMAATNNEMYDTLAFCETIISNCRSWYGTALPPVATAPAPANQLAAAASQSGADVPNEVADVRSTSMRRRLQKRR